MDKAIVIGVGPQDGLGGQLCARVAQRGMHVFIGGRTPETLEARVNEIGDNATAVVTDATDEAQVIALFDAAEAIGGDLKLAIYNAGNNTPGRIIDMQADYFERSWRVGAYGGFLFGREAARRMRDKGGTLLFTGASASLRGRANFGAFNASKSALRTLAQAMAKEFNADGIHVGHIVIDGPIGGEKIKKGLPDYAEKLGNEGMISIQGIVDAYEYLHDQPSNAWSFEVDLRTSVERW
ncbi:MAG: SDR family NAD(P)-dependent oxidoreductase [Gammaproteobacteria bacterium]|nr:SDR family NAD(P)-dependent oxidoreductase [Gammaproteobacteria bacterium]